MDSAPYLTVGALDAAGRLTRAVPIDDLPWAAMMHDFAITRSYCVLLHLPLCVDADAMIKEGGLPIRFRYVRHQGVVVCVRHQGACVCQECMLYVHVGGPRPRTLAAGSFLKPYGLAIRATIVLC